MKKIALLIVPALALLTACPGANPASQTLGAYLKGQKDYSTLYNAIKTADLESTLNEASKSYTLFAPSNTAFEKLSADEKKLLSPTTDADKTALKNLLLGHVIGQEITEAKMAEYVGKDLPDTASGKKLKLTQDANKVYMINEMAKVSTATKVKNGIVFPVDSVLK